MIVAGTFYISRARGGGAFRYKICTYARTARVSILGKKYFQDIFFHKSGATKGICLSNIDP